MRRCDRILKRSGKRCGSLKAHRIKGGRYRCAYCRRLKVSQ